MRTINELLQRLGLFERAIFPSRAPLFRRLTNEQNPEILFITCSDSRIMPDLLFQSQPGEIFITRNTGNLVPPHGSGPDATVAALEFAVCALNVQAIAICGHSNCGAVKALVHPESLVDMPEVARFLRFAEPARKEADSKQNIVGEEERLRFIAERNIVLQLSHLKTYPYVSERLARGELTLLGIHYDIGPGRLTVYDSASDAFLPVQDILGRSPISLDVPPASPSLVKRSWVPPVGDFIASLVVFLIALPLCLGIALASGVPPVVGLVTGILGGLLVGPLSGSPLQVSGPAAGLVVLVADLVRNHGIAALGPALLLAGILQFVAGRMHWGRYFRAMSPAVIYGMLAGIGILIAGAQFHVMLDAEPKGTGLKNLISIPAAIFGGIFPLDRSPHEAAAISGIVTMLTMLLWDRFRPNVARLVPGALVGLISAIAVINTFGLSVQHVSVTPNLFASLQVVSAASVSLLAEPVLLLAAVGIAVIASAETLLSAAAVDRMQQGPRADYDRELRAQGIGNFVCGTIGALPMTGVIVRSSANVRAGARTRWSAILHGGWLLLAALVGKPVLEQIPTSALAAVLVLTGIKLVDADSIRRLRQYGWMPLTIYAATVTGILALDLLKGVLIGAGLTLLKLVYQASRLEVWLEQGPEGGRYDLTLVGSATFLRMPKIAAALDRVPSGSVLHLHAERLVYLDHSCLDLLASWDEQQSTSHGRLLVDWDDLRSRFEPPARSRA